MLLFEDTLQKDDTHQGQKDDGHDVDGSVAVVELAADGTVVDVVKNLRTVKSGWSRGCRIGEVFH